MHSWPGHCSVKCWGWGLKKSWEVGERGKEERKRPKWRNLPNTRRLRKTGQGVGRYTHVKLFFSPRSLHDKLTLWHHPENLTILVALLLSLHNHHPVHCLLVLPTTPGITPSPDPTTEDSMTAFLKRNSQIQALTKICNYKKQIFTQIMLPLFSKSLSYCLEFPWTVHHSITHESLTLQQDKRNLLNCGIQHNSLCNYLKYLLKTNNL